MKTKRMNRIWGILFAIVLVLTSVFTSEPVQASGFQEGTYKGSIEKHIDAMGSDIHYDMTLTVAGGSYKYEVAITVTGGMEYTGIETDEGTYAVEGGSLTMNGKMLTSAAAAEDGTLTINGKLSSFSGGSDSAVLALETPTEPEEPETSAEPETKPETPGEPETDPSDTQADVLASGNYVLTEESYDASAMMKMPAYIVIDAEAKTFGIHPYKDGAADLATDKGSGTIAFDEKTGVYTMTYTAGSKEGATSTFTAATDSITFTSPMYYGSAKMNTTDEAGNFVPYTAKKQTETPVEPEEPETPAEPETKPETPGEPETDPSDTQADVLVSGNYVLTEESYDASAMMKMSAYIVIDAEAKTFGIHPYKDGAADLATDKGSGTIAFDEKTGVYTMTYTAGSKEGATSTFTAAADSITFTSPMYYGSAKMNTTDEAGNFIPYTAKKQAETPVEPEEPETPAEPETPGEPETDPSETQNDVLVSGNYVLTEESYDASAMMKMPTYIVIDAKAKTFGIHPYKDGAADLATNKGAGTITFDAETGVYTMTYTEGVKTPGVTSTFTATKDSITFTSPMYYGSARMNTMDDAGNFIPYTAKLLAAEEPENPTNPTDPTNPTNPTDPTNPTNQANPTNPAEAGEAPGTGDSNHWMIWISLLFVSGAGIFATKCIRRKAR